MSNTMKDTSSTSSVSPHSQRRQPQQQHHGKTLKLNTLFIANHNGGNSGKNSVASKSVPWNYNDGGKSGEENGGLKGGAAPGKGILTKDNHNHNPAGGIPPLRALHESDRNNQPISKSDHHTNTSALPPKRSSTNSSSSAVTDFLKKFSPKLSRSKKSLQWYTVDIHPNNDTTHRPSHPHPDLENDPTLRELQNGRISSEFSTEMSQCLREKSLTDQKPVVAPNKLPMTPTGMGPADVGGHYSGKSSGLSSRSVPVTPVTQSHAQWRMMMVDIDIDRPEMAGPSSSAAAFKIGGSAAVNAGAGSSATARDRQAFFQSMRTTQPATAHGYTNSAAGKQTNFRVPDYRLQEPTLPSSTYDTNDPHYRLPSYIKLSRALNGYSARNMYTSKKLINSRDYNVLLCKSEEYLNRRSTPTPTPTLSMPTSIPSAHTINRQAHSARPAHSLSAGNDFRRAASEDRDLSLVGVDDGTERLRSNYMIGTAGVQRSQSPYMMRVKPGYEFVRKLDGEVEKLKGLVKQGQMDLLRDLPEEAAEQLRSAVGKTNLLLTQKFEQFRQLCNKNISERESDALKTTVSDLQGYWDMMSIQICDVERMFSEVERMRRITLGHPSDLRKDHYSHHINQYHTPSSNGSDIPSASSHSPKHPAVAGGARRSSKPKVTFQLNERDMQRKEMIAAKRKEYEEQRENSSTAPLSSGSVGGGGPGGMRIYRYLCPLRKPIDQWSVRLNRFNR